MSNLLQISNLSICFDHGPRAVDSLSLAIREGQTLALVGESGSGKSISALSVLRLLDERHASYPTGEIFFRGEDMLKASDKRLRQIRGRQISMIFQEPMTSLNPLHTVEKQIGETLALHKGMRNSAARKRCIELLELVGIQNPESRLGSYPHQLSGGQKQRVMIAMALANEPELLIADEPTTALDVTVQKQVLELLRELQQKLGMAILLITHDLSIVHRYADEVAVMEQGKLVELADTETLFDRPKHPYTRKLLDAEPPEAPLAAAGSSTPLLSVSHLDVRFSTRKSLFGKVKDYFHAVQDTNFSLNRGETLGIVGESGSGKTTIGHALLKLTASTGSIQLAGEELGNLTQKQFRPWRSRIQIVFQDPFGSLSPRMSIAEIVREGLEIHEPGNSDDHEQRVIRALRDVGLDPDNRHRYPHEFSGGQRQRIAIARALVLQPDLIILDEPTSALDRTVQKQVIELLRDIQGRYGLSYIFISHDLAVVRALSHKLLVLHHGKIVEYGNADDIFHAPSQAYTQELLSAAFFYQNASTTN
ncbi:ABC transporter ATP-binding protein [Marinobacter sp. M216]|uniref:ABC transporter ATP-binding protein n=1 Tax=Marinobacter albus TaxID=3030833 RepID=A0ABT7HBM3_9GAMM|nr:MULTISPECIES: ABC transporter ATP-binding protein [unclassified Marinobacter]MBW7469964.1 ABC transporter ATP-binding protein [Marinobacter sp. F4218]MDK9557776.1 ABC transporter ATP-binding protein [Marinobacter sp. M216]